MKSNKIKTFFLGILCLLSASSNYSAIAADSPVDIHAKSILPAGKRLPAEMLSFERILGRLLYNWKIPGASVAIVNRGKLVYAKGFGYANLETRSPVQPDSVFRIASVSKIFTAVAILKLVEEGKLSLDTKVFPILKLPPETSMYKRSPLIDRITVRHLLECSAGWDRKLGEDQIFTPILRYATADYSNSMRPTADAIIRYACRKLDFEPGSKFAYSNITYTILGKLISKVTGKHYKDYVLETLISPLGLNSIQPGRTLVAADKEVHYYGFEGEMTEEPVMPNIRGPVSLEYGGEFYLEASMAEIGWIASSIDVARFVSYVLGDAGKDKMPLSRETVDLMISRPNLPDWEDSSNYFSLGWEIENAGAGRDMVIKKEGCISGSTCIAYHRNQTTLVVSFNSRPVQALEFQEEVRLLIAILLSSEIDWNSK